MYVGGGGGGGGLGGRHFLYSPVALFYSNAPFSRSRDRRRPVRREGGTGETEAYAVLVPKKTQPMCI